MRSLFARMLLGATLLVAGVGMVADGSPFKNPLVQSLTGMVDLKERFCRKSLTASGAVCPAGCAARPARFPADRAAPPECHSALWLATCGSACAPADGFARGADGGLIDGTRLVLTLAEEPHQNLLDAIVEAGVTLEPRFDGLYRYDAILAADRPLEKTKKRLAALPGVTSVDVIPQ